MDAVIQRIYVLIIDGQIKEICHNMRHLEKKLKKYWKHPEKKASIEMWQSVCGLPYQWVSWEDIS